MKIIKLLVGIVLIPFCIAVTQTLVSLVRVMQPSDCSAIPSSAWALGGGFLVWLFLYFVLPRPVRTYVLAHELTHALWGLLMDAKIFRMRISAKSGSVTLSKTNFIILLAPYFFPLYTVLVIAGYYVLSVFFDMERYYLCWLSLIGFTWGFHFTFTISTLLQHQTDVKECGRVFSYAMIYLMNIFGICLWIVIVSSVTLEQMVSFTGEHIGSLSVFLLEKTALIFDKIRQ
ncbi:hypothetical protein ACFLS1_11860 [Verrucomicrobiota bacterium]